MTHAILIRVDQKGTFRVGCKCGFRHRWALTSRSSAESAHRAHMEIVRRENKPEPPRAA